jgi:uncharacterized damage-inducible protein DinB
MGAFTYPRSEPGSAGHMDLVEQLNANTARLRSAVGGLDDAALSRRSDGGWSIKDVVGHLCDVSRIMRERLHKMIKLEEPQLARYDADALASGRNAQSSRIEDLLAEYAAQRAETVDMLSELVHWNWARTGRHPTMGKISIRQQVDAWLAHEDEHLAQIASIAGR